jgi:hypothetical protein
MPFHSTPFLLLFQGCPPAGQTVCDLRPNHPLNYPMPHPPSFQDIFKENLFYAEHFALPFGIEPKIFELCLSYMYGKNVYSDIFLLQNHYDGEGVVYYDRIITLATLLGLWELADQVKTLVRDAVPKGVAARVEASVREIWARKRTAIGSSP